MITPIPGATVCKPGSATLPFFGIKVALLDKNGVEIRGPGEGNLVRSKAKFSTLMFLETIGGH